MPRKKSPNLKAGATWTDRVVIVPPAQRVLVNLATAADFLSISQASCRRLIDSGDLPSVKLGDRRLVTREALDDFARTLSAAGHIAITGAA